MVSLNLMLIIFFSVVSLLTLALIAKLVYETWIKKPKKE